MAAQDVPDEGRVRSVVVDGRSIALTRCGGRLGALENHCPHQGGPLGEGSIEQGLLRCPWHGYDYDPVTGAPPGALAEHLDDRVPAYDVEEGDDGVRVRLPDRAAPARTVADVLVETLVAHGVDTVFGMVGHSNLGFADALRRAEERGELRFVGIRHEGAAAFAASAYGKLTGRPAACFAIAGPGSTNLLTGLYDAKLDGAPGRGRLRPGAVEGARPRRLPGPRPRRGLPRRRDLDDHGAVRQRPRRAGGPGGQARPRRPRRRAPGAPRRGAGPALATRPAGSPTVATRAARSVRTPTRSPAPPSCVAAARRPVIVVGHGARGARDEVVALAEQLGAPVLTTFKAKGLVPDTHPLGAGVLGRSGTPVASWLMNEADLLLVVGRVVLQPHRHRAVADDRAGRRHPDRDRPLRRGHRRPARRRRGRRPGPGRGRRGRPAPAPRTSAATSPSAGRSGAPRRRAGSADDRGQGVSAAAVFAALSEHLPEDAVVAVDVGNHAYSLGRYLESKGQPVLMSGYLGSIGFGYPAAMGAWAADPTRPVVAVTGDGGFGQYAMELTTAVHHGIPVKHVLLNNNALGKISKEQLAADYPVWHTSLTNPDWAAYAELCGARGLKVTHRDQLDAAMAELFAPDGPGPALRRAGRRAALTPHPHTHDTRRTA